MIDKNHICEIFCIFKELKKYIQSLCNHISSFGTTSCWLIYTTNCRSTILIWIESEDDPVSCVFGGDKFFKNQIAKKVLRSAKPPLYICYSSTQNAFLSYLNCAQVCAIFVFHKNICIIKIICITNIQFKNNDEKYPPKNLKICLQIT